MSRSNDLLRLAADALTDGIDPFNDAFLSEHGVTLDECYTLSENLALGAKMLLSAKTDMAKGGLVGSLGAQRLADAIVADALGQ